MSNEFDPQAFGSVLARLDAQDRQLLRLEKEVFSLSEKMDELIRSAYNKKEASSRPDWVELIVGSILGAVAYFVGASLLGK